MNLYLQALVDGLLIGGVYASIAVGLSLAYGVMRITNWAHGEMLMISMYISFFIFIGTGIDPYLIIFVAAFVMFIVGYLFQKGIFNKMLEREKDVEPLSVLMFTVGLSLFLSNLALAIFGGNPMTANTRYTGKSFTIGPIYFSVPRTISFVIAVTCTLALYFFLKHSEMGRAIRAISQKRDVAPLMGIDTKHIYSIAFGISLALVGISGALLITYYPVVPTVGTTFSLRSFIIVVLGGQGSIVGALFGGLIIGIIEKFGALWVSDTYAQMLVFIVFIAVLLFKPNGLFGKRKCKLITTGEFVFNFKKIATIGIGLILFLVLPLFVESNLTMQYLIHMLLFAYLASSWNAVGGFAGQLALGNGVYMGIGAYASTILFMYEDISPWIGMIIGGIIAAFLAYLIGKLTFRLSGVYFALSTVAMLQIVRLMFISNDSIFGYPTKGALGLRIPWSGDGLIDMQFDNKTGYYYVILFFLIIAILISYYIKTSRLGYYLRAIGTNPEAAQSLGVNVMGMKLIANMISAFMLAVGGTFYVQYLSVLEPNRVLGYDMSIEILLFAIVGGRGTITGPIFAAFILAPLQDVLRGVIGVTVVGLPQVFYGLILMIFVYYLPEGIWPAIVKTYRTCVDKSKQKKQKSLI